MDLCFVILFLSKVLEFVSIIWFKYQFISSSILYICHSARYMNLCLSSGSSITLVSLSFILYICHSQQTMTDQQQYIRMDKFLFMILFGKSMNTTYKLQPNNIARTKLPCRIEISNVLLRWHFDNLASFTLSCSYFRQKPELKMQDQTVLFFLETTFLVNRAQWLAKHSPFHLDGAIR